MSLRLISSNSCIVDKVCFGNSLVTEYRISRRVAEQFEAFMSGFNELIPQELINVFDERELEVGCCHWWTRLKRQT